MVMNIVDERSKARKVVEDTNFDYLIMFLICMDAVVLGLLTAQLENGSALKFRPLTRK